MVVNERDEIGSDLVPDYMTSVRDGGFYGWPYSYFGQHVDERVKPLVLVLVQRARAPDFALGTHVAPLGLTFDATDATGNLIRGGAFIGLQRGSRNCDPPAGYEVVFVAFRDGQPHGKSVVVLDGFRDAQGNARGRPWVSSSRHGALLVADDVGNAVWRVTGAAQ